MIDFHSRTEVKKPLADFSGRRNALLFFMMLCMVVLVGRAIYLQVFNKDFLKEQGDMRLVDEESVSAYRGMITDRSGAPLAISTPVVSVSVNPRELKADDKRQLKQLEKDFKAHLGGDIHVPLTDEQKAIVLNEYRAKKCKKSRKWKSCWSFLKAK